MTPLQTQGPSSRPDVSKAERTSKTSAPAPSTSTTPLDQFMDVMQPRTKKVHREQNILFQPLRRITRQRGYLRPQMNATSHETVGRAT